MEEMDSYIGLKNTKFQQDVSMEQQNEHSDNTGRWHAI